MAGWITYVRADDGIVWRCVERNPPAPSAGDPESGRLAATMECRPLGLPDAEPFIVHIPEHLRDDDSAIAMQLPRRRMSKP